MTRLLVVMAIGMTSVALRIAVGVAAEMTVVLARPLATRVAVDAAERSGTVSGELPQF